MTRLTAAIIVVILIIVGVVWYTDTRSQNSAPVVGTPAQSSSTTSSSDLAPVQSSIGTFSYTCSDGNDITMTPADDMSKIELDPNGAQSNFPSTVLMQQAATSGARYEGQGMVLTALGETLTIERSGSSVTCKPVQNPDMAPFNFGD